VSTQRPKIIGLAHMAFQASNVEQTLAWYRNLHGYEEQLRLPAPLGMGSQAFVMINEAQWIEICPELAPGTDRLLRFGFQVEDAEAMMVYLVARGVPAAGPVERSVIGNLGFSVKDPDGHAVEFVQCMADGWPARAADRGPGPRALSRCMLHVGFDVSSLARSLTFYGDTLGCTEIWRGTSDSRTLAWVQLRLPDDRNYLELMLYGERPSLPRLGILNHFGLEVTSIPAVMEEVSVRLLGTAPVLPRDVTYRIGQCRHRLANVFDPDGTRAEFMERETFDGTVTPPSTVPPPR
jgi:catechol 2,3-dioxygenase-like lactoylglutathione lyase family enzyme